MPGPVTSRPAARFTAAGNDSIGRPVAEPPAVLDAATWPFSIVNELDVAEAIVWFARLKPAGCRLTIETVWPGWKVLVAWYVICVPVAVALVTLAVLPAVSVAEYWAAAGW